MKSFLTKLGLAALAALAPIHGLMIAVGVLIIIDLVAGLWRAIKSKEKITSSGLQRTIINFCVFQTAIITAFLFETYFLQDIPVIKIVAGIIGLTEALSIFESLNEIYGGNLFRVLLDKLGSKNAENQPRRRKKKVEEDV